MGLFSLPQAPPPWALRFLFLEIPNLAGSLAWGLNLPTAGHDHLVPCGRYRNDKRLGGGGGGKREEREPDAKKCYDANGPPIRNTRKQLPPFSMFIYAISSRATVSDMMMMSSRMPCRFGSDTGLGIPSEHTEHGTTECVGC